MNKQQLTITLRVKEVELLDLISVKENRNNRSNVIGHTIIEYAKRNGYLKKEVEVSPDQKVKVTSDPM